MTVLKSLEEALADAEDVLEPEALFRLSEILVEEVSVVDRAANKRRFITVKRDQGDSDMTTTALSLTGEAKSAVKDGLTGALTDLVELSKTIEDAQTADDGAEKLPAELMQTLKSVTHALSELMIAQASKGAGSTAESLVQIAEMSMMLAEEVATAGEVDAEVTARMKQMSKLLETITTKAEGGDEGDGEGASADDANKGGEGEGDGPGEKKDGEGDSEGDGDSDGDAGDGDGDGDGDSDGEGAGDGDGDGDGEGDGDGDGEGAASVDDSAKSDDRLDKLTDIVAGLAENVNTLAATVAGQQKADEGDGADGDGEPTEDPIQKQLDEMKQENKELRSKLSKATEEPPARASTQTPVSKGADGRRVFPMTYGDPIHDPTPEA